MTYVVLITTTKMDSGVHTVAVKFYDRKTADAAVKEVNVNNSVFSRPYTQTAIPLYPEKED